MAASLREEMAERLVQFVSLIALSLRVEDGFFWFISRSNFSLETCLSTCEFKGSRNVRDYHVIRYHCLINFIGFKRKNSIHFIRRVFQLEQIPSSRFNFLRHNRSTFKLILKNIPKR